MTHQTGQIKKLERRRDELRHTNSLAGQFNYAREPHYVRDRVHLLELSGQVRQLICKQTTRLLDDLVGQRLLRGLHSEANKLSALSGQLMANKLKLNYKGKLELFDDGDDDGDQQQYGHHEEFIETFVEIRKASYRQRALADQLEAQTLARRLELANWGGGLWRSN